MIEQTSRRFTGRHMLIIMLAFFAVVLTANMTMVYFANHSWTGLVVKNSYVASQEFNETTQKLEQAAASFHATLEYSFGKLQITLRDSNGKAVEGRNVVVSLGRPSHEGEDQNIALTAYGQGIFKADLTLAKGQWAGSIRADVAGHTDWQRPIRLFVKE